ncbi:MAG: DNA-binding domain-containing protein [Steroidobacteraceae bacterium]
MSAGGQAPRLRERQREFAAAVLDPDRSMPAGLVDPRGHPCPQRFGVYRNNVLSGLIEALQESYPALCRLVGVPYFRALARLYVIARPPRSPVMLEYGAHFAAFLAGFEPVATWPYLPEVARIERAWVEAYHAADAAAVDPSALAAVPAARVGALRFTLHPSLRVVRCRYPALTIWRMNVAGGVPGPVDLAAGAEDVLLVRPEAQVEVRALPAGGARLLAALGRGRTLAEAVRAALPRCAPEELIAHLAGLLDSGAFTSFWTAPDGCNA